MCVLVYSPMMCQYLFALSIANKETEEASLFIHSHCTWNVCVFVYVNTEAAHSTSQWSTEQTPLNLDTLLARSWRLNSSNITSLTPGNIANQTKTRTLSQYTISQTTATNRWRCCQISIFVLGCASNTLFFWISCISYRLFFTMATGGR